MLHFMTLMASLLGNFKNFARLMTLKAVLLGNLAAPNRSEVPQD